MCLSMFNIAVLCCAVLSGLVWYINVWYAACDTWQRTLCVWNPATSPRLHELPCALVQHLHHQIRHQTSIMFSLLAPRTGHWPLATGHSQIQPPRPANKLGPTWKRRHANVRTRFDFRSLCKRPTCDVPRLRNVRHFSHAQCPSQVSEFPRISILSCDGCALYPHAP